MIIVPGGPAWEKKKHREIIPDLKNYILKDGKIAAICSATTLLGDMGVLDTVKHTSNAKSYLQHYVPAYQGGNNYMEEAAVRDKNIITATGTAPVEFAREIFKALSLMNDGKIEEWFQLFKNGIWEKSEA
jgi:putative intracellular protease/amidase